MNPISADNLASILGVEPAIFKAKRYSFAVDAVIEISIDYGFVFLVAGTGRYNISYVSKYTSSITDIITSNPISHTKDTDGKVNVYFENQKLYAQNKTGVVQALDVCAMGNGV